MLSTLPSLGLLDLGERSVDFYKTEIIKQYASTQQAMPALTVIHSDFTTTNSYLPDQFDYLKPLISKDIKQCIAANISTLLIPNITLHETIDQLAPNLFAQLKLIHPVAETIRCLQAQKINSITLIGSKYSTSSSQLEGYFQQNNITIIRPDMLHIEQIDDIRKRTYLGQDTAEDNENYHDFISLYQQTAPVVIACTELSLLLNEEVINSVFDMARIQINALLN